MPNKRLTSNTSTPIYHPLKTVWDTIGNFHDLSWCPNVVSSCVPVGEISGFTTGAKRVVNDDFHERLRAHNSDVHLIGYFIEDGPPPISTDESKGVHVQIKLNPISENATDVEITVISSAENRESVEYCTATCVAMFDDLRKKLE